MPSLTTNVSDKMKKITKLLKKRKNPKLSLKCCKFISNPQKIIGLRFFYRFPGDILLEDDFFSCKLLEVFSTFRKCKKIMNVFEEKNKQIIGSQIVNYYDCQPPFQLLVCRLQSLGDIFAYNLSKTIERIIEFFKNIVILKRNLRPEEICMRPSYNKFLQDNEKLLEENCERYPLIVWRASNFENAYNENICEVSFNYQFLNLIGEEIKTFPIKLLKKGIPTCLYVEKSYFQTLDMTLNDIFFQKKGEEEINFFTYAGDEKIKMQKINIINRFQEDSYHECFLIQTFKIKQTNLCSLGFNLQKPLYYKEIMANNKSNQNLNVFLEKDNFTEGKIKLINDFYSNVNIKIVKDDLEEQENLRCSIKKL